jgi:hypothetical protein
MTKPRMKRISLLLPPQEFIVEHGGGVGGKKLRGASKRSQSLKSCFGFGLR